MGFWGEETLIWPWCNFMICLQKLKPIPDDFLVE